MANQPHASDLIQDLSNVPNIIGGLGLSIASAQKAFDVEFLDSVERIIAMAKSVLGSGAADTQGLAFIQDLIMKLAPSRYQFTETTLSVRLDLAQSLKVAGSVGLGFGVGAINVNAAFTLGYAYDYQAAAQCQTVIHAYPMDAATFKALLDRAATLNDKSLELPARSQVDQVLFDKNSEILQKITGQTALPVKTTPSITKLDPATVKNDGTTSVSVTGTGFTSDSTVDVYTTANPPTRVDASSGSKPSDVTATTFKVKIPTTANGTYQLQVVNPSADGKSTNSGFSDAAKFTVTA